MTAKTAQEIYLSGQPHFTSRRPAKFSAGWLKAKNPPKFTISAYPPSPIAFSLLENPKPYNSLPECDANRAYRPRTSPPKPRSAGSFEPYVEEDSGCVSAPVTPRGGTSRSKMKSRDIRRHFGPLMTPSSYVSVPIAHVPSTEILAERTYHPTQVNPSPPRKARAPCSTCSSSTPAHVRSVQELDELEYYLRAKQELLNLWSDAGVPPSAQESFINEYFVGDAPGSKAMIESERAVLSLFLERRNRLTEMAMPRGSRGAVGAQTREATNQDSAVSQHLANLESRDTSPLHTRPNSAPCVPPADPNCDTSANGGTSGAIPDASRPNASLRRMNSSGVSPNVEAVIAAAAAVEAAGLTGASRGTGIVGSASAFTMIAECTALCEFIATTLPPHLRAVLRGHLERSLKGVGCETSGFVQQVNDLVAARNMADPESLVPLSPQHSRSFPRPPDQPVSPRSPRVTQYHHSQAGKPDGNRQFSRNCSYNSQTSFDPTGPSVWRSSEEQVSYGNGPKPGHNRQISRIDSGRSNGTHRSSEENTYQPSWVSYSSTQLPKGDKRKSREERSSAIENENSNTAPAVRKNYQQIQLQQKLAASEGEPPANPPDTLLQTAVYGEEGAERPSTRDRSRFAPESHAFDFNSMLIPDDEADIHSDIGHNDHSSVSSKSYGGVNDDDDDDDIDDGGGISNDYDGAVRDGPSSFPSGVCSDKDDYSVINDDEIDDVVTQSGASDGGAVASSFAESVDEISNPQTC